MLIVNTVLSVLLPIFFGALLKYWGLFKEHDSSVLRRFVVSATVPFLVFRNLYEAKISELGQILPSFSAFLLITALYTFYAYFTGSKLARSEEERTSFALATMFGNYGYMGWGVVRNFYGQQGLTRSIFFTMFFWPVFLLFGFGYIFFSSEKSVSKKTMLTAILKNALVPISAALLGIFLNIGHMRLPVVLESFISSFAGITVPAILFTIGLELKLKIKKSKLRLIVVSAFSRLFLGQLFAVLTVILLRQVMTVDQITIRVIMLETVMPAATMVPFFCDFANTDKALLSSIITFSTLLSLGTLPLWYLLIERIMTVF